MSDLVPACPYSEERSWADLRAGQKCGKGTFLGISQYTTLGLHPWAPSGQVSKSWFFFMTEQYSSFRLVQMKPLWQLYKGFCEDITFHFSTINICWCNCWVLLGFPGGLVMICLPMQETQVWSVGWEDPLEKEMTTHSNILTWEIPRTEEPEGLQSMGLQRLGHDLATKPPPLWKVYV